MKESTDNQTTPAKSITRLKYTTMNVTPAALAAFNLLLARERAAGFKGTQSDLLLRVSNAHGQ